MCVNKIVGYSFFVISLNSKPHEMLSSNKVELEKTRPCKLNYAQEKGGVEGAWFDEMSGTC